MRVEGRTARAFRVARGLGIATLSMLLAGGAVAQDWEKITAPESYSVEVNGEQRDIAPRCISGSPSGDHRYSFYFRKGKSDKLVVLFNGGGACWNAATCGVGWPQPALYVPTAETAHNDPKTWGGLLNADNPDNPFRDWSVAFLPYCTADVHVGSKTTTYLPGLTITHHGFDNFLYARDWLAQNTHGVRTLLVAGASAGAYGAALNYPHLRQTFPAADASLIGDAGNGVLTEAFLAAALDTSWGGGANLAPPLAGLRNFVSEYFLPAVYGALTFHYRRDHFSQYTAAWDASQTFFYNVMLRPDAPQDWFTTVGGAFLPWHVRMQAYAHANALAPNYRFFIAQGCEHSILRYEDRFDTKAVHNVAFVDWLEAQAKGQTSKWKNVNACTSDGGCPFPADAELGLCLQSPL